MRWLFVVFLLGVGMLVAGVALFDWRAGLSLLGALVAAGALFWDGER